MARNNKRENFEFDNDFFKFEKGGDSTDSEKIRKNVGIDKI